MATGGSFFPLTPPPPPLLKLKRYVVVNATLDLTYTTTPVEFYAAIIKHKLVWLYDNRWQPTLDPRALPASVDLMSNDMYRSLAYFVRCNGGYQKETLPFQDFYWSNYFRGLNLLPSAPPAPDKPLVTAWSACDVMPFTPACGYKDSVVGQALQAAMQAAAASGASGLPGFGRVSGVTCQCPTP